jgi:ornithine decarboxylase
VQAAGVAVDRISFGNTIKKEKDIAWAYQQGVRLFAFDSEAELQKLVRVAPGAQVFCRVLVDCGGAEWPLSKKFGCAPEMAKDLLRKAKEWGLDAYGISFHVGSQQTDLEQWDRRSARSRRCSSRSPKRASTCAWSTWAAASRRAIGPRSTASRPTARR